MEAKTIKIGGSLPVPCVQELAKEPLIKLPARYIRLDKDPPCISDTIDVVEDLPVIDMQRLVSEESMDSELGRLHLACRDWGFFQLINHGVDSSLLDKVKMGIRDFFNLPMEEKKKFWQNLEDVEGFGQAFVVSEEQKLSWGDMFFMITLPKHLRKRHLFPKLPSPFREALEVYSSELKNLAMDILAKIAKALKMDIEEMREAFEAGLQTMRMNYYPPCPEPDKAIGINPHSDAGGLTLLLQVNEVEGLQIRKDGNWVPIKPLPNAFIVNIGDMMEVMSNGTYHSIEHRAVVNSTQERLSIATFYSIRYDGEVGPTRSMMSEETPALFKRVSTQEFLKARYDRQLHGRSYLDAVKVQPDTDRHKLIHMVSKEV